MIDGDGRLSGTDAIKFFAMSNLPRGDLKQVNRFLVHLWGFISASIDYTNLLTLFSYVNSVITSIVTVLFEPDF